MIRKLLVFTILFSMTLHCASRLGLLEKLYEQRHRIAHSIGLIAEVPIAICNSDYDFDQGLKIEASDESDQSLPSAVFQAREIQLFFTKLNVELDPELAIIRVNQIPDVLEKIYYPPALSIFHPPS